MPSSSLLFPGFLPKTHRSNDRNTPLRSVAYPGLAPESTTGIRELWFMASRAAARVRRTYRLVSPHRGCFGRRTVSVRALIHYRPTLTTRSVAPGWFSYAILDFIGPLHWFPTATGRIVGLSLKVDRGFKRKEHFLSFFKTQEWGHSMLGTVLSQIGC